jgi:hypothetical protein
LHTLLYYFAHMVHQMIGLRHGVGIKCYTCNPSTVQMVELMDGQQSRQLGSKTSKVIKAPTLARAKGSLRKGQLAALNSLDLGAPMIFMQPSRMKTRISALVFMSTSFQFRSFSLCHRHLLLKVFTRSSPDTPVPINKSISPMDVIRWGSAQTLALEAKAATDHPSKLAIKRGQWEALQALHIIICISQMCRSSLTWA